MKLKVFIFLYVSLCYCTWNVYAQDNIWLASADSTVYRQMPQHPLLPNKTDTLVYKEPIAKDFIHFQLDTSPAGQPIVLMHLKDSVDLLTISAHDMMGASLEVICEHQLNQGFYEFTLPKAPSESLKYWQISMDGQRVISFIR